MARADSLILTLILINVSILFQSFLCAEFEAKIVNGTKAKEGEFPFIISVRRSTNGRHRCGGSLLNRAWVLTAAHCVAQASPSQLNVQYASNTLNPNSTKVSNISKIYVHDGYLPSNKFIHDIALLKLQNPVTFGGQVNAVRLPAMQQDTAANATSILLGWGLNATGGSIQKDLQKVQLQIFSDAECSERHQAELHATTICAGVPQGGKGQCSGDSGGPLLVNGTQVGVVSWSRKPCTLAPYPGVFTEVSAYIDWILKTIGDDGVHSDTSDSEESLEELMSGNLIIVSLQRTSNNRHFCAGTILCSTWILTAAHCFTFIKDPHGLRVQYGSSKLLLNQPNIKNVTDIVIHEGYNPTIAIHDIAMIKLESPIAFHKLLVHAVDLPKSIESITEESQVVLTGWGLNETFGALQDELQKVELRIVPHIECRQQLNALLHKTTLCAGALTENKGQCSGDSGGPLLVNTSIQIGIVSWSLKPCGKYPGVFTNVSHYRDWIHQKLMMNLNKFS